MHLIFHFERKIMQFRLFRVKLPATNSIDVIVMICYGNMSIRLRFINHDSNLFFSPKGRVQELFF